MMIFFVFVTGIDTLRIIGLQLGSQNILIIASLVCLYIKILGINLLVPPPSACIETAVIQLRSS